MRMTEKRIAAEIAAREVLKLSPAKSRALDNDTLYRRLNAAGHIWNSKAKNWERGSTSMFTDADGEPTGVIRLRFMGNEADVFAAVGTVKKNLPQGAVMTEVSDPYPNRRGAGVRIYATVVLQAGRNGIVR